MFAAVGCLAHEAAHGLLALLLLLGLGAGLGGGFLGEALGVDRGLLGVAGLLLKEKEGLAHGEGLAPVARGQRCGLVLLWEHQSDGRSGVVYVERASGGD